MLQVKLGRTFAFLPQTDIDPNQALLELLGDVNPMQLNVSEEMLRGLSGEWLLFDYKPNNGKTLIEQYYFSDPDNLGQAELSELKQIIETQSLHLFQTYAVGQPPYIFLQSVFTGKKFKIFDKALSKSIDNMRGSFFGRIAKVDKTYYLVGSNPINLPIRHTSRSIKIFAKQKTLVPSLKDIIIFLTKPEQQEQKITDFQQERKKLEKRYQKLAAKFQANVTFAEVVKFVYKEKYDHNFGDFITDLMKMGIPEVMCIENINLFQEMWNYFPHQQLDDKCPYELYEKEL